MHRKGKERKENDSSAPESKERSIEHPQKERERERAHTHRVTLQR